MEDHQQSHHPLLQPLILHGNHPTTTTTPPSQNDQYHDDSSINILVRFISVIFIGLLALYANHEASKGFDITIVNDIKASAAGRRFQLFYVSNDKATRIILHTSNFVEHLLYPNHHPMAHPKKHINRVVLRLSNNFTSCSPNKQNFDHFVLHISPSIMDEADTHHALVTAIRRGMTRVWLFDGGARAPPELIDGMVEYVRMAAEGGGGGGGDLSFGPMKKKGNIGIDQLAECDKLWWKGKEPLVVALLLNYYEGKSKGFIQRLNGAMKEKWEDRMVDDALGMPLQNLCGVHNFSTSLRI